MLKVFLAEDEYVIREGIKNNIKWSENGYELCGTAGDGELAYSQILKDQPDILVTDIKMPFMDGLTLSRMVKAQFPWIEIILLTGYEDFAYARDAINIGVASYLSKPISSGNLLKEINNVGEKILEKRRKTDAAKKYEEDMNDIGQYLDEVKGLFAKYQNIKNYGNASELADLEKEKKDELEEAILAEVDPRHIDRKSVKEFLRRGNISEIEGFVRDFLQAMGKNVLSSTMLRQYVAMDFYFCVSEYIETELMLSKEEYENMIPATEILSDEKSTYEYLISILDKTITLKNENNPGRYSEVVKEMLEYIDEHYSDEELSLNQIAFHVNFSPNHLSAIFRQQTGQNFIKYLTDYRMEKAKELLMTTSKKSNEIGLLVGYRDPHYFSYLFKKTQGVTTTQYRERGQVI